MSCLLVDVILHTISIPLQTLPTPILLNTVASGKSNHHNCTALTSFQFPISIKLLSFQSIEIEQSSDAYELPFVVVAAADGNVGDCRHVESDGLRDELTDGVGSFAIGDFVEAKSKRVCRALTWPESHATRDRVRIYSRCKTIFWIFIIMGHFFYFYLNGVTLKKIINLDKSCQLDTISYVEVVLTWHDIVHIIYIYIF